MAARVIGVPRFAEPGHIAFDEKPLRFVTLPYRSCSAPASGRFPIVRSLLIAVLTLALFAWAFKAQAAGDLSRQVPLEVRVQLGDDKGVRRFFPERIELETGKLYRLILSNPSPEKHYFSSDAFAQAVFTRKVQVNGADGNAVAEIKGWVREIEVLPKGTTEWWLVPIKTGQFGDLKCTVEGHTESGMVGLIVIR